MAMAGAKWVNLIVTTSLLQLFVTSATKATTKMTKINAILAKLLTAKPVFPISICKGQVLAPLA